MEWRGGNKRAAKRLFGRPLRIALALWVQHQDEPFFLSQAQEAMRSVGEAGSNVADELQLFAEYGMVNSFRDGRRLYYSPMPSKYWAAFEAMALAVELGYESDVSSDQP